MNKMNNYIKSILLKNLDNYYKKTSKINQDHDYEYEFKNEYLYSFDYNKKETCDNCNLSTLECECIVF